MSEIEVQRLEALLEKAIKSRNFYEASVISDKLAIEQRLHQSPTKRNSNSTTVSSSKIKKTKKKTKKKALL